MNATQILQALAIADELLTAGQQAYQAASNLIATAHKEGRDITDAELDGLRDQRNAALDVFHKAATA